MMQARKGFKVAFRTKGDAKSNPARTTWVGYEKITLAEGEDVSYHPIEAWDDDGGPLIVKRSGLVCAQSFGNFIAVVREPEPDREPVQMIPASEWRVWRVDADGTPWNVPLAAWVIMSDGCIYAAEPDSSGDMVFLGEHADEWDFFICLASEDEPSAFIERRRAEIAAKKPPVEPDPDREKVPAEEVANFFAGFKFDDQTS